MSFILHCRHPANTPAEAPGYVNVYHHVVSRFAPRIGMLPTPWDDITFAFLGDVVQQQASRPLFGIKITSIQLYR